ncbi:MAG: hypothetical protein P1U63_00510 [Coxiellaceae bacterium]|nr:hypothetical protein [Coxiellaceae bacterium]
MSKVVFSLDHDGCADAAVRREVKPGQGLNSRNAQGAWYRQQLLDHLKTKLFRGGSKPVVLNGSLRQYPFLDEYNARCNRNYSVHDVLPDLAEDLNAEFIALSMADAEVKVTGLPLPAKEDEQTRLDVAAVETLIREDGISWQAPGYSWRHYKSGEEIPVTELDPDLKFYGGRYPGESSLYRDCPNNSNKTILVRMQIEYMRSQMAAGEVLQFYFFDDRPEILDAIEAYFLMPGNLPDNVVLGLCQLSSVPAHNGIMGCFAGFQYRPAIISQPELSSFLKVADPTLLKAGKPRVPSNKLAADYLLSHTGCRQFEDVAISYLSRESNQAARVSFIKKLAAKTPVSRALNVLTRTAGQFSDATRAECYQSCFKQAGNAYSAEYIAGMVDLIYEVSGNVSATVSKEYVLRHFVLFAPTLFWTPESKLKVLDAMSDVLEPTKNMLRMLVEIQDLATAKTGCGLFSCCRKDLQHQRFIQLLAEPAEDKLRLGMLDVIAMNPDSLLAKRLESGLDKFDISAVLVPDVGEHSGAVSYVGAGAPAVAH